MVNDDKKKLETSIIELRQENEYLREDLDTRDHEIMQTKATGERCLFLVYH